MPLVKNEQDVKRDSQFLKYDTGDMGNVLILKSNLYKITSHFLQSVSKSVACKGDDTCMYCAAGYQKNSEYNYLVYLNGSIGYLNVKPSVFFAIQGIAKAQKKDPRQISWTVIKKGDGLSTEYTTSKDDNLSEEDFERATEELEANNKKLEEIMERHEESLEKNYIDNLSNIKGQQEPARAAKKVSKTAPEDAETPEAALSSEDEVNPDDVPF